MLRVEPKHVGPIAKVATSELEGDFSAFINSAEKSVREGDLSIIKIEGWQALKKAAASLFDVREKALSYKTGIKETEPETIEEYLERVIGRQEALHPIS